MSRFPLEELKQILRNDDVHFSIALIQELSLADDRSFLKCFCNIISEGEDREIVARMTWENVGPDSGDFQFPSVGDLVLVAYLDAEPDMAFIIRRFTSKEDTIPQNATGGDRVIKSLAEKNIWITAQNELYLSRSDAKPSENLVLGQAFQRFANNFMTYMEDIAADLEEVKDKFNAHSHAGMGASPPASPIALTSSKDAISDLKSNQTENNAMLSDYAFTSKN